MNSIRTDSLLDLKMLGQRRVAADQRIVSGA